MRIFAAHRIILQKTGYNNSCPYTVRTSYTVCGRMNETKGGFYYAA